ncbi:MAG TPA: hypothetical protein VH481_09790 [Nitrososphaeraceae archaeon]
MKNNIILAFIGSSAIINIIHNNFWKQVSTSLRTAISTDDRELDKEQTSYSDLSDALRNQQFIGSS